ncbi:MAG: aminodeoxychorismate/anthranilate synthase component II [Oscillospiraceae bacterium]|nr:aminodeoxychorismate/anthranilate synthase component II [Ruminococcus sp.]MCD8346050.1 aminodeoxychorismate/anthranilate synthase component II [Oscillospiraceae bacterium]
MVILIDNYDSFTYNLVQLIGQYDPDVRVVRNDAITVSEIVGLNPDRIVISPGPGKPSDAGICEEVIEKLNGKYPILGVCLGHQAICEVYGATVTYAPTLMHGKQSDIHIASGSEIFRGLPPIIQAARYHSLAADKYTIPDTLRIIAESDDGTVMAVEHRDAPTFGIQFHPESIMTPMGKEIIENFIKTEVH